MAMSNYLEGAILNGIFRNTPYTSPTSVYLALYTSDPTDTDIGTEVNEVDYARQLVTFDAPVQVADKATMYNSTQLSFAVATTAWGTITHVGIRDASTGGNLLYHGALVNPRAIEIGDRMLFFVNDLQVSLD